MGYILQITGCDFCMLDEKMHVKKDMAVTYTHMKKTFLSMLREKHWFTISCAHIIYPEVTAEFSKLIKTELLKLPATFKDQFQQLTKLHYM